MRDRRGETQRGEGEINRDGYEIQKKKVDTMSGGREIQREKVQIRNDRGGDERAIGRGGYREKKGKNQRG